MRTHKLYYKEQGELFGFVNQEGNWVVEPVYHGGDKEFTDDMYCIVLEKYVGAGSDDHNEYHLVDDKGDIINLSKKIDFLEDAGGIYTKNELIQITADDLSGLYSFPQKKIILKPIARDLQMEDNGLIYIEADGDRIMDALEDGNVIVENDFGYMDKHGNFIQNRGELVEILKHDCYIVSLDEIEVLYSPSEDEGTLKSGDLVSDIRNYETSESGNLLQITLRNRSKGIYNLMDKRWEFKPTQKD